MNPPAVVDASVVLKWVLLEPGSDAAERLLREHLAGSIDLLAPSLLFLEIASALARHVRRRIITPHQATEAFDFVAIHQPWVFEPKGGSRAALDLALDHGISLWDAVYLTLAIEFGAELLTSDGRLYRALSPRFPQVRMLA